MRFNIKTIVAKNWHIILLISAAAFLRLYKIYEFTIFIADQGRDALIIRKIATLQDFPSIGPTLSVGGAFLGPFYYYLMTPFLLLAHFNPVGLSIGVALISLLGILVVYKLVKKEVDLLTAILFTIFLTFSFTIVNFARFSWNPNLLPFVSFITLFFFYKLFQTNKPHYALLAGAFFSIGMQLHFLMVLLIPTLVIYGLWYRTREPIIALIKHIGFFLLGFVIFYSPLIYFDLKNNFLNTHLLLKGIGEASTAEHSSLLFKLQDTFQYFLQYILNLSIPKPLTLLIVIALIIFLVIAKRKYKLPRLIELHTLNVLVFIFLFSLLNSQRHPHYYTPIYYSMFLTMSYVIVIGIKKCIQQKVVISILIALIGMIYVATQFHQYGFLFETGNNQIGRAQRIAKSIISENPIAPYHIAGLPFFETEDHIRYYLEVYGKTPLEKDSPTEAKELFVICHVPSCQVLGNPQWQIASFKKGKISKMWSIDELTIYKVIHEK